MGIIIFILIFQSVLFFSHLLVYKTAAILLFPGHAHFLNILKATLITLSFAFIPANLLASRYYNVVSRIVYALTATWLGFFLYFFTFSVLCWAVYLVLGHVKNLPLAPIFIGLFTLGTLAGFYGIFNANHLRVTQVGIDLPNLPKEWQNKKAVFISDTHFGQIRGEKSAQRLADKIHNLHPDIVFIGGDFYDGVKTPIKGPAQSFAHLGAPLGTYFITGNHEEFSKGAADNDYVKALQQAGVITLNNQIVSIDGLQIIGVDYASASNHDSYKNILESLKINKAQPSILLKHEPSGQDIAKQAGVSLQLSGHTHNGQMFPFSLLIDIFYKGYIYGLRHADGFQTYISSGAGTWGPPMRVGNNPEIVVITFH